MNKNFVFRKLSPELEEVLIAELHTLKGGTGGVSDGLGDGIDLDTVDCIFTIPNDEEEEEEEEETPDPTDINNPYDDDYEDDEDDNNPWDDEGWDNDYGGDENEDDKPVNCNLKYNGMPVGAGTDKQFLNTCGPHVLSKLSSMAGNYKSTDSIINSVASARVGGATDGVKFQIANAEVQLGGLTDKEYSDFIDANFLATSNDGDFNSIKDAINRGNPVTGHVLSDVTYKADGTVDGFIMHAIMITGVTAAGGIRYYDPQIDEYVSNADFSTLTNAKEIDLGQEIQLECIE